MKNILLACTLGLTLFSCKTENVSVLSFNNKITIDGYTNDWNNQTNYIDPSSNIECTISNDKNNVYFLLKLKDTVNQMKLFRGGLEINIDTLGKSNYPITIIFPYSIDRENNDQYSYSLTGITSNMDYKANKQRLLEISKSIRLIGFKNGLSDVVINSQNRLNIKTSLKFDENDYLIYELSVPIGLFVDKNVFKQKAPISFNFKLLGLPNITNENSDNIIFQKNEFTLKTKFFSYKD